MSYYTTVGGGRARLPSSTAGRTGTATANRQLAAERAAGARAEKAAEGERLRQQLDAIDAIHRARFEPTQRPIAPSPPPVDRNVLLTDHRRRAKKATSIFNRTARNAAYAQAARDAEREAQDLETAWHEEEAAWQSHLDEQWAALCANDPDTVLHTLAEAFSDNEAAAAAVGIAGAELTLVVVVPPPTVLPDRRPTVTAAGNLSLKKLTKRESSDLYKTLVCGHMLVTVQEAFAVAPSVATIKAVAVRPAPVGTSDHISTEVLVAAEFQRSRLQDLDWGDVNSLEAFDEAAGDTILITRGATRELVPLDVSTEPLLADVSKAIDFEDLLGG